MAEAVIDNSEVIIGHAKKLFYSDDGLAWTKVRGTIEVNLPERELIASEITNDDSPDYTKEYIPGMYEPGTVGFTYRYNKTGFAALETIFQLASASGTRDQAVKTWKVELPDGSTAVFDGFLTSHNLPIEGEDSPVVEGEIQIVGKMTWTSSS